MKKKIWMAFGACCALFLILGVVQGIRNPEIFKEGLDNIAKYDLSWEEESGETAE